MKKKIGASKAKKLKEKVIIPIIPLAPLNSLSYLDRPTIAALHEIDVSVQYAGNNVYLVKHKGPNHHQMLSLPTKDRFNEMIKKELKVDIAPLIIKHREKDCFTCNLSGVSCLDPKTCGQPIEKDTSVHRAVPKIVTD